jgi:hypothetical protein
MKKGETFSCIRQRLAYYGGVMKTQTAKTISLDSGLEITTYRNSKTGDTLCVHHNDCGAYYGELVQASDPRKTKQRVTTQQVNELISYWHYEFGGCSID